MCVHFCLAATAGGGAVSVVDQLSAEALKRFSMFLFDRVARLCLFTSLARSATADLINTKITHLM